MQNQDEHFNKDTKVISLFRRSENKKRPYTHTPPTINRNRKNLLVLDNQPNIYHYNTEKLYYEDQDRMPVKSRYMDFYYNKLNEEAQLSTCDYCSQFANLNVEKQNWPVYDAAPIRISLNEDQNLIQQTTVKRKPNKAKSRYLDYLKNKTQPLDERRTRTDSTRPFYKENINTIPIYTYKRERGNDSDENENDYVMTDTHEPNLYCDQLDRRSRLCHLILNQQYSLTQLPDDEHYEEKSFKEKPSVQSDSMHFWHNSQDGKKESSEGEGEKESTHSYEHGEGVNKKPQVKSRYMDFYYKNLDKENKPATDEFCAQSHDSNSTYEEASENTSDYQSPILHGILTQKPKVIKSRFMDWDKDQPSEVLQKEPVKFSQLDWHDYHRLHTIHNFLDEMQNNFPSLCTTGVIGSSLENRDLKVLKVSNSNVGNANVWIDAGIHAREWIAPAVNTYIINYIVNNFNKLPTSMQNKDWYFLPVMNPDGYEYSHTNYRMWRKNKAWVDNECLGVDLNRNFSVGWGGKGSSDEPKSPFYRGPYAFSEPESRAVRDMLKSSGMDFKVYITLHSFGEVILFPFAYRDELCPDYVRLLEGATVMSKAINAATGNIYKVGISRDVMRGAAGTSCDWSYGEAKIPFCYLLELRSKKHRFRLPEIEIEETGKEILSAVVALMNFVDDYDESGNPIVTKNILIIKLVLKLKFKVAPPSPQVWEVKFTDEGQKTFVRSLDTCGAINIWKEAKSTMDFFVDKQRVAQVAAMLHERGIPFSVSIRDVDDLKLREQGSTITEHISVTALPDQSKVLPQLVQCCLPGKMELPGPCMNWTNYHSLRTIYTAMDELAASYPYLCNTFVIGKTCEGRDIKLLKISNGCPDNKCVWLDGDIHAREWVSVCVVTFIADKIVKNFHQMPESVTNKDWYILPVMNPDGYVYTHTTDRMWRKNRGKYGQCVGVDLNRNFSFGWGEAGEDGSSEDPGSIFYRGPKPFSEPETNAVKRVILEAQREFKVFLSFHSYGEVIIFPWGYTSDPCPSYVELLEGGTVMARAIHSVNGRTYKVGSTKDLMYYSAGTSVDWSYGVAHIPYSYMIELPSKQHRFLLPKEQIIGTATEVYSGVMALMQFVDKRSKGTSASTSTTSSSSISSKL